MVLLLCSALNWANPETSMVMLAKLHPQGEGEGVGGNERTACGAREGG